MNYVLAGYTIVFVTLALYSLQMVKRGRDLSRQLPEEERRFLD